VVTLGGLVVLSELTLPGYFLFDWEGGTEEPPHWRTPLSLILMPRTGGPGGAYPLLVIGLALMLACAWSLQRAQLESTLGYRMEAPRATSASSLAMHSATLCKISIVLTYNVSLLLVGPEIHGWHTPQTAFYCLFSRRSRFVFDRMHAEPGQYSPHYDYYLLLFPLALVGLMALHHFNMLRPGSGSFLFSSGGVLKEAETEGEKRVRYYSNTRRVAAAITIQRVARLKMTSAPTVCGTAAGAVSTPWGMINRMFDDLVGGNGRTASPSPVAPMKEGLAPRDGAGEWDRAERSSSGREAGAGGPAAGGGGVGGEYEGEDEPPLEEEGGGEEEEEEPDTSHAPPGRSSQATRSTPVSPAHTAGRRRSSAGEEQ
jgi:hypothetical protein